MMMFRKKERTSSESLGPGEAVIEAVDFSSNREDGSEGQLALELISDQQAGPKSEGSTVLGASFNLSNSIVGAGCIGFGGAIAESGGLISILMLLVFGYLTKVSFDLLIDLSMAVQQQPHEHELSSSQEKASYETLGYKTYGNRGRTAVIVCKGAYSFMVLVAYIIIIRDNFASAVGHLLNGDDQGSSWWVFMLDEERSTIILCTTIMLPLCLLRDIKLLEGFSVVKIATFFLIIFAVIYLYVTTPQENNTDEATGEKATWNEHWLQIRPGFIQNMGTFVFTFMSQHTIHILFQSLRPDLQTYGEWRKVSTLSVLLSLVMSVPIGLFAYMTYWERTTSNLFEVYPPSPTVDIIQVLLCMVMLLTYPPSFFAFRQLIVDTCIEMPAKFTPPPDATNANQNPTEADSLLSRKIVSSGGTTDVQLSLYHHALITILIWAVTLTVALVAPTLGDILNLAGCAFGTAISFILPALFCYRLRGVTMSAAVLFLVGGTVGIIGTFQSLLQLIYDMRY